MKYSISWEIELIDAVSPLDAAKKAQEMICKDSWSFYVQDEDTKEIFSVDLNEDDEDAVLPIKSHQCVIVRNIIK